MIATLRDVPRYQSLAQIALEEVRLLFPRQIGRLEFRCFQFEDSPTAVSVFDGLTINQQTPPSTHNADATRNEAVQP